MTAINADVSADQEWLPLSDADSLSLASGFYTIDSENVKIENGPHPASSVSNPIPKYNGRRVQRGVGGSTAASHTSGATLTRYYPEAPGGTGSGGVTVDNTVDPPFAASTIVAPGATESAPDEATLSTVTIYQRTVTILDADIKTLPTLAVELVPALGADKVLRLIGATQVLHLVGDYIGVDASATMALVNEDSTYVSQTLKVGDTLFFDYGAPADLISTFTPRIRFSTDVYEDIPNFLTADQALTISVGNSGVDFTGGDPANTLTVVVWYGVVDLA